MAEKMPNDEFLRRISQLDVETIARLGTPKDIRQYIEEAYLIEDRTCIQCKKVKPVSEYYVRHGKREGQLYGACKTCYSESAKEYCASHQNSWRKRLYGLTEEGYDKLFVEQNGCCGICGKHRSEMGRDLDTDHNHQTGQVRGLLCMSCNTKLGWYAKQKHNILAYLGDKDNE